MNTVKTTMLMALLIGVMVAIGGAFGGRGGALLMLLIALGMNLFSYWFSDSMVLSAYSAREVNATEAPQLYHLVQTLAARAGLPMPKVCIVDSDAPNAFATGRNPDHAAVAVTTGLMRILNYEEIGSVLAHELSHVKHRDTLISTLVAAVAGAISMIANMAQWAAIFGLGRSNDDNDNGGIVGMLLTIIVAPLAAFLIQMAISRTREYAADESGGEISGNPLALASALEKIEYYAENAQPMEQATPATSHMFIINPLTNSGEFLASLFRTHPLTKDRIARLRAQAERMRQ